MTTRLAVCQYAIDIDDPEGTRSRLLASVAEAAEAGAQVIVLPELCTSGYVFRDLDECWSRAEPADGKDGLADRLVRHQSVGSATIFEGAGSFLPRLA